MAPIKTIEKFRVKPRWLFVKITDEEGRVGWGEGTLEGHSLAVEGALDEIIVRLIGKEAKYVMELYHYRCIDWQLLKICSNIEHIWQLVRRLPRQPYVRQTDLSSKIWRLGFYRGGPVFMSALSGIGMAFPNEACPHAAEHD